MGFVFRTLGCSLQNDLQHGTRVDVLGAPQFFPDVKGFRGPDTLASALPRFFGYVFRRSKNEFWVLITPFRPPC